MCTLCSRVSQLAGAYDRRQLFLVALRPQDALPPNRLLLRRTAPTSLEKPNAAPEKMILSSYDIVVSSITKDTVRAGDLEIISPCPSRIRFKTMLLEADLTGPNSDHHV